MVASVSLAIELYFNEKVSLAKAAELAGMTTIEFKEVMTERGIVRETEGKSAKEIDKKLKKIGVIESKGDILGD